MCCSQEHIFMNVLFFTHLLFDRTECVCVCYLLHQVSGLQPAVWWMWFCQYLKNESHNASCYYAEYHLHSFIHYPVSLSLTILPKHDHNLRVSELSLCDGEGEVSHALAHVGILIAAHLFHLLLSCSLSHFKHQWGLTETQVLCRHVAVQEDINTWREIRVNQHC